MGDVAGTTTAQLAEKYLRARRLLREHSRTTQRTVRYTLAGFVAAVPADPNRIRVKHVLKWMDQPGCKDSTMATKLGTVRAFLGWASATGEIKKDPTFGMKGPKRPRRLPRAIDAPDIEVLFDTATDRRLRCAESLMACEGLRLSEVVGVQLGDIDWRNRSLRIIGKGDKEREVHLTPASATAIKAYLAECPTTAGPLIRSTQDQRKALSPNRLGRLVSEHMAAIGLKEFPRDGRSPHALRHSYGSDLVEQGATIVQVADLMGHESIDTTMRYQRRSDLERTRVASEGRSYAAALRPVAVMPSEVAR